MKAVIIAGGLGTRLRPLTYNTPKPIVPVANRPFILHQIELLKQHGITEIILNLHYLTDEIKSILGDGRKHGVKLYYSHEKQPLGTAGAVKNAEEFFDEEPLLIFNGDVLTDINLSQIIAFHKKHKARATLTLTRVEDPTAYGLIVTDPHGVVTQFIEKPSWEQVARIKQLGTADTINAGIYVLDPKVFRNVPAGVPYSFERQLFPDLLAKGELVCGFISDRYWMDIGKPSQYRQAHEAILRNEVAVRLHGTRIDNRYWLGDHVKLAKSVKLSGPSIIGQKVTIADDCKIKDFAVIGDGVTIGKGSSLTGVIVWEGAKIGAETVLDGCIIGYDCVIEDNVTIGPGAVLADRSVVKKGSTLCSR
ncbi:MAG: NDP-sugar synthase [Candidatus Margulisbacteria bacterium]|nr:NDP-sugar synthase [Candidatus Margulisiibacteriota bacterium]